MQNYNLIERVFHNLTLGNNLIKRTLYEVDKFFFHKDFEIKYKKHVFITGLPRSGTTILLNFLNMHEEFFSLKYLNMPLIMSPNISGLLPQKKLPLQKRLHDDGIMYDLNSPEMFDEIFFLTFQENEIKEELINYIQLILIKNKNKRYLSKNNYNYNRINLITSILPNSLFLIPIREPINQSYSLFKQHQHFLNLQKKNSFIQKYMNYLGHFEFGLNHKPWSEPENFKNRNNFNYWLEQWILFYNKIYNSYKNNKNCYFIIYETLDSETTITSIKNLIGLKLTHDFKFEVKNKKLKINFDKNLYNRAKQVYYQFVKLNKF